MRSQLFLATNLVAGPSDALSFARTVLGMQATIGLPTTVLADTGLASGPAVTDLRVEGVDPPVAIRRIQSHRPYDFRPLPEARARKRLLEHWRIAMKAILETDDASALYRRRKQNAESPFGINKNAMDSCVPICATCPTLPPSGRSRDGLK